MPEDAFGHYLTVAETAAILRVSKMTVYRSIQEGALTAYKFGRSYRIRKEDLSEYIEHSRIED